MKNIIVALMGLFQFVGLAEAGAIPNCYTKHYLAESESYDGMYDVTINTKGLSADHVFNVVSRITDDPIWPTSIPRTNRSASDRKTNEIIFSVVPNMHRFPRGTSLSETRAKVENTLRKIAKLRGVTISCTEGPGE
jgi:hypothetical protein